MYNQPLLDQIRERIALSDIVGKNVQLKKRGHEYHGLCPFHKEKTPSFTVNNAKGFYHCFGCGKHGSVFDFLMFQNHYTFIEAVKAAAEIAGVTLPKEVNPMSAKERNAHETLYAICEKATVYFVENLKSVAGERARDYLMKERHLTAPTLDKFQMGWAPADRQRLTQFLKKEGFSDADIQTAGLVSTRDDGSTYDKFRGRIMFPITDRRGRVVAFGGRLLDPGEPKYLNSPETPIFHKGHILYNWAEAQASSQKDWPLLVVEGYMDAISLREKKYERVVAPLGTAMTEHHIQSLWRLSSTPIVCFDGDQAGERAALRAAERALPLLKPGQTLSFAFLPYKEDPDTFIQKNGLEKFKDLLKNAVPLSQMIWNVSVGTAQTHTPESKALVEQKLERLVHTIQDTKVRAYYQKEFKDRLFRWNVRAQSKAPVKKSGHKLNRLLIQESILLGTPIAHPALLPQLEEALVQINFSHPPHQKISTALLNYLSEGFPLETEHIHTYLEESGLKEPLETMQVSALRVHAPFLEGKDTAAITQAWHQVLDAYQSHLFVAADLKAAKERLSQSLTPEEWQRFKSLKEAFAHGDDKKDI